MNPVLAGRFVRLVAHIVDSILAWPFLIPGAVVMSLDPSDAGAPPTAMEWWGIGGVFLGLFAIVAIQAYFITTRGQSLGKMLLRIEIVLAHTLGNAGFGRAVLLRSWVNSLLVAIPCVGTIYGLVDALFIFGERRQCVHDLLAGTLVIEKGSAFRPEVFD